MCIKLFLLNSVDWGSCSIGYAIGQKCRILIFESARIWDCVCVIQYVTLCVSICGWRTGVCEAESQNGRIYIYKWVFVFTSYFEQSRERMRVNWCGPNWFWLIIISFREYKQSSHLQHTLQIFDVFMWNY